MASLDLNADNSRDFNKKTISLNRGLVSVELEVAVLGGKVDWACLSLNQDLVVPSVGNEVGDGDDLKVVFLCVRNEAIEAHHGAIFNNHGGLLPIRLRGYHREYYGNGIERGVIGAGGDVWFSDDHYASFLRVY